MPLRSPPPQVLEARETETRINEARNVYRGVSARGSQLFFLLNSLGKMHAFYQYSLSSFVDVFERGIDTAPGGRRKPQAGCGASRRRVATNAATDHCYGSVRWLPSHSGALVLCLQPQK